MRDGKDFHDKIKILRARVDELGRRAMQDQWALELVLPDALAELLGTLEELQVAEEELRQQNEELSAARQAIEAEQQRYRALFDFAPDGYLVTDPDGTIQEANRAAAEALNVRQDFLVDKPFLVYVADVEAERETFHIQLTRLQRGEETQLNGWHVRLQPRNGVPFPAALTVAAVRDPQGELTGLRWMLRDVTERERLLARIQVQAQHLRHLMEAVPEGLLLLDADWRILLANPAARRALFALNGADADAGELLTQLGPRPLADVLDRHTEPQPVEITLDTPFSSSVERLPRTFESQAYSIGAAQPRQWVLALREVTREREAQRQIQARERLATVGQLAAGIAHDFNNILASIVLYAGMLLRASDLSSQDQSRLRTIHQQGHRAAKLVEQILDFARQSVMQRKPLMLLPFLQELEMLLVRTLPESIQIQLNYGHDDYVVNADPTRLQQVVMNLALNARDAMPLGGRLRFQCSRSQLTPDQSPPLHGMPPGEWVCLTVADTGVGIPPDVLPHIFEPFFTTKEVGQGTGLGLAQVYGIVQQHEGHIGVESRVGQGTTFTIYLPAFLLPELAPAVATEPLLVQGHGETILVVEDDRTTQEALCATLEALGYRVRLASEGQEALALYDDEVALVISDLVMPKVGGAALYAQLAEQHAGVKMMMITGYPLENEGQALLEQGIAAWVQKPFSAEELSQVIQEILG